MPEQRSVLAESKHEQGTLAFDQERYEEAARLFTEALEVKETADGWNDWATAQMLSEHRVMAERGYRRALELDGTHQQAAANLGILLVRSGRFGDALPLLERAINGADGQPDAMLAQLATHCRERLAQARGIAGSGPDDKTSSTDPIHPDGKAGDDYLARIEKFNQRALDLGLGDLRNYYWYHSIDLGEGLVTPGIFDLRDNLAAFRFPEDMRGMTVLDVGSATGFFAFEFEKRGARVISVELPSLEELDRLPGRTTEQVARKIQRVFMPRTHSATQCGALARPLTSDEVYFHLMDGPFRFCHQRLNSKVERCYSTVYDLSAEKLGIEEFDMVFLGNVLLHTIYPLKALAAVAPLCTGTLVLSQLIPQGLGPQPAMLYAGGDDPEEDGRIWWFPNKQCFEQLLHKLGFKTVEEVGRETGVLVDIDTPYDHTILHAKK
jgi:SAM-dependent methyltransferase